MLFARGRIARSSQSSEPIKNFNGTPGQFRQNSGAGRMTRAIERFNQPSEKDSIMRVSRHISPQRVELPPATAKGDLSWKLCATNKLGWKFEGDFLAYNLDAPEYIPTGRVTAKRIQYRAPRVVWIRHEYFEREYDDRAIIL